ncbi:MAG TPA: glycine/sarcosine/betaine reductase selenoprotein B family protein [Anaerolineae bacterium]|nr:glycine/sarcosine/betaine reductase selenoprotein B family protein [Anaerolineae bacterium]
MTKSVDSYRFLDFFTRRLVKKWISLETPREIPWTPLSKPLAECTVALISSAGLALKTDQPFDQEGERRNPWWGDPSYRIIPRTATGEDVRLYHLHINPRLVEEDLNSLLPLQRLLEFEANGEIGQSAPRHYSFMGYILRPESLLKESTPAMIHHLQEDQVDVVLLVPG